MAEGKKQEEDRSPIPISCFSVVIVRRKIVKKEGEGGGDEWEFAVVEETEKHNKLWYFPAGINIGAKQTNQSINKMERN